MIIPALGGRRSALAVALGSAITLGAGIAAAAQTTLTQAVRDAAARNTPVWISYRVPIATPSHTICFDGMTTFRGDADDLRPATSPSTELVVYARVNGPTVERLRVFTPECAVDTGSTPVIRLAGVAPAESVAWLASMIDNNQARVSDAALLALSLHADPTAITRLVAAARDNPNARVRGQALFWLAQRAGDRAVATITAAIDQDPETAVKKKAVFALSQLPKDEGVPKLIEVARTNRNPAVRKQAMFWLGQSKDPRAIGFFEDILKGK